MSDNEQQPQDNKVYTLIFIPALGQDIEVFHCRGTQQKCRKIMKQQAQHVIDKIPECCIEVDTLDCIYIFQKKLQSGYIWSNVHRDLFGKFKIVPLIEPHTESFEHATPFDEGKKKDGSGIVKKELAVSLNNAIQARVQKKD